MITLNLIKDEILTLHELRSIYSLSKTFYSEYPLLDEETPEDYGRPIFLTDILLIASVKDLGSHVQITINDRTMSAFFIIYGDALIKRSNVEVIHPMNPKEVNKAELSRIIHEVFDVMSGKRVDHIEKPVICHDERMKRECREAIERLDDTLHEIYDIDPIEVMVGDARRYIHMNEKKMS